MATYTFYWSPEGRPICSVAASNPKQANAEFKRRHPEYKNVLGEVYFEVS